MEISPELVRRVAKLASLELSSDEMVQAQKHLQSIVDYAAELAQFTLDDAPEQYSTEFVGVERADERQSSLPPDQVLANAPAVQGTAFLVPRMID